MNIAVPPSTTGKTYYVNSKLGSDSSTGLVDGQAFATIAKAISLIAAGDTVLIHAGLYREGINLSSKPAGTAGKPITFGAFGDGEVIVDGSAKVSNWVKQANNTWRAPISFTPIAIVANDIPLKQTPDALSTVTAGSNLWFYDSAAKAISADFGSLDPNTSDIVVPSNVGDQTHVFFYGDDYTFKGLTVRGSGASGIWGYGSHITVERCNLKFNGKAGVVFFANGDHAANDNAVLYTHVYHNVLLNWPRGNNGFAESGGGWSGGLSFSGTLRGTARGNLVHMNGGEGIIAFGSNVNIPSGSTLFEQNVAFDNWSVNMYFDNLPNNIARNNILFNHPPNPDNWLRKTDVYPWNGLYKYSVCLALSDEENSSDAKNNYANLTGSQVYNNLIAGCRIAIRDYSEGNAHSILYHGLRDTLIANNTIIMPPQAFPNTNNIGLFLQDNTTPSGIVRNSNSFVQNNLIIGFDTSPLVWLQDKKSLDGITLSHNLYYNAAHATPLRIGFNTVNNYNLANWMQQTAADAQSLASNPLLQNANGFQAAGTAPYNYLDASPGAASPARGAGTPQTAFNYNLLGAPRTSWNIGAF
jgi:Chondroitinase B